jgi:hypothetical protein
MTNVTSIKDDDDDDIRSNVQRRVPTDRPSVRKDTERSDPEIGYILEGRLKDHKIFETQRGAKYFYNSFGNFTYLSSAKYLENKIVYN